VVGEAVNTWSARRFADVRRGGRVLIVARLGDRPRDAVEGFGDEDGGTEQFKIDAGDFLSARERGGTTGTRIEQQTAALSEAA